MQLGLDMSPLTPIRTGVGNYVYELMLALAGRDDVDIHGYALGRMTLDRDSLPQAVGCHQLHLPTSLGYWAWQRFGRPSVEGLTRRELDVVHGTNFYLPSTRRAARVISVHDISFVVHPDWMNRKVVSPYADRLREFCDQADAVITFSEFTKREMVEHLDADGEKIHVTPHGIREEWCRFDRETATTCVQRYGIDGPYLLYVSTIEERKNVPRMLEAFATLTELPHKLVLVGRPGWMPKSLDVLLDELNLRDRVHLPGYVSHRDVSAFYAAADAFVFPSLYEGFGFPLLEAFVSGCPVVTANTTCLPEVGGDAVELVDPMDVDDIARGMMTVVSDTEYAGTLRERGKARAGEFSWSRTANQTMSVYRSVMA